MTQKIKRTLKKIEDLNKKVDEAVTQASKDCLDDVIKLVFNSIHSTGYGVSNYICLLEKLKLDFFLNYDCEAYRTYINTDRVNGFAEAKGWKKPKRKPEPEELEDIEDE